MTPGLILSLMRTDIPLCTWHCCWKSMHLQHVCSLWQAGVHLQDRGQQERDSPHTLPVPKLLYKVPR